MEIIEYEYKNTEGEVISRRFKCRGQGSSITYVKYFFVIPDAERLSMDMI
jgi:hypothetical protein